MVCYFEGTKDMSKRIASKLPFHYAWVILFTCCMMFGSAMGLLSNCSGIYTAGLTKDNNWTLVYTTVIGISCTVSRMATAHFTDRIFRRVPMKLILSVSFVIFSLGYVFKSYTGGTVIYLIANILVGIGGTFLLYIPVPILLNNWFVKKKETAIGIAMLSSGLMAAIGSPVYTHFMELYDWRAACRINAISALLIALPPILLFAEKSPEDIGLTPYGYEGPKEMKVVRSPSEYFKDNTHPDYETGISVRDKKVLFIYSLILAMVVCNCAGLPAKFSHFAITSGLGAATGALMLSLSQIGNMLSKASLGALCDRFGPLKTYTTGMVIVFISFAVLCFMPSSPGVLYVTAFFSGICAGCNMLIYPAAVRTFAKGEEYTSYIARISQGMTFFGTPFGFLINGLFDITGGYFWVFIVYTVLWGVCVVLTFLIFSYKKNALH